MVRMNSACDAVMHTVLPYAGITRIRFKGSRQMPNLSHKAPPGTARSIAKPPATCCRCRTVVSDCCVIFRRLSPSWTWLEWRSQ